MTGSRSDRWIRVLLQFAMAAALLSGNEGLASLVCGVVTALEIVRGHRPGATDSSAPVTHTSL